MSTYPKRTYDKPFETRPDSGNLFAEPVKKTTLSPDYSGTIALNLKDMTNIKTENGLTIIKLSGWKNVSPTSGKTYLALVLGLWPSNKKVIDLPLQRYLLPDGVGEGERRVRIAALTDPGAQRAITLVRVARLVGDFSLLEVTIKTGRTHQIRVHLASQGYPIVGDDKYGDFSLNKRLAAQGLKRMFLHAWRLQFIHPSLGKPQTLQADLPPELQQFVDHVQPPPPSPI